MLTKLTPPTLIPKVISKVASPPLTWLGLKTVTYHVPNEPDSKTRTYELVYRPQQQPLPDAHQHIDANDVIAITKSHNDPNLNNGLVVVMQYRPAVNAFTIEFPAGCIDPGERDYIKSAMRELDEETGLHATESEIVYTFTYEPGISSGLGNAVTCLVDMDNPENISPKPKLEDGEWSLRTFILPLHNLHQTLIDFVQAHSHVILDSRLGAYALGLEHAAKFLR